VTVLETADRKTLSSRACNGAARPTTLTVIEAFLFLFRDLLGIPLESNVTTA
jgi:hypothetical protein